MLSPKLVDLATDALAAAKAPADAALTDKVLATAAGLLAEAHGKNHANGHANGHSNGVAATVHITSPTIHLAPKPVAKAKPAKPPVKARAKTAAPKAKPAAAKPAKPKGAAVKSDKASRKQAVLDAVASGLATRNPITSKLGFQPQDVTMLLGELKADGTIVQCGDRGLAHYGMTAALAEAAYAATVATHKKNGAGASAG